MALSATGMRTVMTQVRDLQQHPVEGIILDPSDDLNELDVELIGPDGTPYAGGLFRVALCFPAMYPEQPPKGYFRTCIFHPNVSERGDICVNVLKKDWNASLGIRHVLTVIRCLLIEPNAESALNDEAGKLILEDFAAFARKARMLTNIHGIPRAEAAGIKVRSGEENTAAETAGNESGASMDDSPSSSASSPTGGLRSVASTNTYASPTGKPAAATKKAVDKKKAALKRI